jgi:hypothetical protein
VFVPGQRWTWILSVSCAILAGCFGQERERFDPPAGSFSVDSAQVGDGESPVLIAQVDSTFFNRSSTVLLVGRMFYAADLAGETRVAILSHSFWRRQFLSAPTIIGQPIQVAGVPHVVIGVMGEQIDVPEGVALWIPRR